MKKESAFIAILIFLAMLVNLINTFTKIYQCSAVFVMIAIIANFMYYEYGRTKGILGVFIGIASSSLFMYNSEYQIGEHIVSGLIATSCISLSIALFFSTRIFIYLLQNNHKLYKAMFASIITAAVIDAIIMTSFLLFQVSLLLGLKIAVKEILFKVIYGSILSSLLFCINKFAKIEAIIEQDASINLTK